MAKIAALLFLHLFGSAAAVHQKDTVARSGLRHRLQALAHRNAQEPATDTVQTVQTLNEVVNGINEEEDKNMARKASLQTSCRDTQRALESAISQSERAASSASDDLQAAGAQVQDMQAAISSLQEQITSSSSELDNLQVRLKELREQNGAFDNATEATLLAVEQAAGQAKRMAREQHRVKAPSAVTKQVSYLEELSNSLTASELPAPSFLQLTSSAHGKASVAAVDALNADKEVLLQSRETSRDDFSDEEKNVLELIEIERKKLQELEKSLEDQQPTLANKLQQSAELNQTLASSNRGLVRDRKVLETSEAKCSMMLTSIDGQKNLRLQVSDKIRMAVRLLETMDASMFLSKDVTGLKSPPSFMQIKSRSDGSVDIQDALLDTMSSAGPAPPGGQAAVLGLLAEASSSDATSSVGVQAQATGPFDQVTDMIRALVASLKDQANEAVNKDQFCHDSMGQNRRERLDKKNTIDMKKSAMRFSSTAMSRLDGELAFLTEEIARLNELVTTAEAEKQGEQDRVNQEAEDHRLAVNIISEVMSVLTQLCELDGAPAPAPAPPVFLQTAKEASSKSSTSSGSAAKFMAKKLSKFSQCGEAVTLLQEGVDKFGEQDTAAAAYLTSFESLSSEEKTDAESSVAERTTEKTQKEASRADQADAKATAEGDLQSAQNELALIEEAKTQLEKDCGPGTETHEERQARRQEEIEALKSAYDVLDGESVPV